jgi:SAM-dependent methyltransferase
MSQLSSSESARKAVIAKELAWHEQEADRRLPLDELLYAPPAFERVVESALDFLRVNAGEQILDVGCGEGKETVRFAQRGLVVVSTDLSHVQLCRARQLLQEFAPGATVFFIQANAEELPFADHSFRSIHGKAIIHHLDIRLSALEFKRLLKQNGRATFAEPMAYHPFFWLGRKVTPRHRTQDEHPLTVGDLRSFGAHFEESEIEEHFLLAPMSYFFRLLPGGEAIFRPVHRLLQRIDRWLFACCPFLRKISWYAMIKVGS